MYFYVFIQPEIFEEAAVDGEDAIQNVASILKGFLQNCFLSVFEDDRWDSSVREKLEKWPETSDRAHVTKLLVHLKKQHRFLYCIKPDYNGKKTDIDCVFEQAEQVSLDVVFVIASEINRVMSKSIEVATRRTYQHTNFEVKRSKIAVDGKTCKPGEMDENTFLDFHFRKALKHATTIDIYDQFCGKGSFTENFRYTIKKLMNLLRKNLYDPNNCKIIFHFRQPRGEGSQFISDKLTSFKKEFLPKTSIEVHLYDESIHLPHQRFIVTDQIALNIDRGLDFIDKNTKRCRDTYINYQDPLEARKLLKSCTSAGKNVYELI